MILSFSGDPFLAHRAARRELASSGYDADARTEVGDGMTAETVTGLASQMGLFGQPGILLDFDAAFTGQGGVKPRNAVLRALETLPDEAVVVVVDSSATASRQKTYRGLGDHTNLPTPRFGALVRWVRDELEREDVAFERDVPDLLADLFGEDLPAIASEIRKLAVLGETLGSERVREIVNRPAARDAFDAIEAIARGDAATALQVLGSLEAQGEPPPRILGALAWQFQLVARCVGVREGRARTDASEIQRVLRVSPYVAKKALGIAANLDEATLGEALDAVVEADVAMKTGKDDRWALNAAALRLARVFAS